MIGTAVSVVIYGLLAVAVFVMLMILAMVAVEIIEDVRGRMPRSWHDRRDERLRVERACRQMERVRRDTIAEMERVVREHQQTRRPVRRPKGTRPRPRPSGPVNASKEKVNKRIVG